MVHLWNTTLRIYETLQHSPYAITLVQSIASIANQIVDRRLLISDFLEIKALNSDKKNAFLFYIHRVIEVAQLNFEKPFEEILQECIEGVDGIITNINVLRIFIDELCKDISDYQTLQLSFAQSTDKYETRYLNDFSFSPEIQAYLLSANKYATVVDSYVYKNYYLKLSKDAVSPNLNSQNIVNLCDKAYKNMISDYESLFLDFDQCPMEKYIQIFNGVQYSDKEIYVIKAIIDPDKKLLESFKLGLDCYINRLELEKSCNSLNELTTIGFSDKEMLRSCEIYINNCIKVPPGLLLKEFIMHSTTFRYALKKKYSQDNYMLISRVIEEIGKSMDLIRFLTNLQGNELEYMKEGVNDYEEVSFINTQTVFDLENIWIYIHDILRNLDSYEKFTRGITERHKIPRYRDIFNQLKNCTTNLNGIEEFHRELNCKEDAKKKQIIDIYTNSEYVIQRDSEYKVKLVYLKNTNVPLNLENLLELKDRASLIFHTSSSKQETTPDTETFRIFIDFIMTINTIIISLAQLDSEGYPGVTLPEAPFKCTNGEYSESAAFKEKLSSRLVEWKAILVQAYEEKYWLTFLHGQQFWVLEQYLLTGEKSLKQRGINLLQYMGKRTEDLPEYLLECDIDDSMALTNRLMTLGEYLENITRDSIQQKIAKKIHALYVGRSPAIIQESREILFIETTNIVQTLVSLYLNSGFEFPRPDQFFYCRMETDWVEISAFLYRCFKNSSELYVLINGEDLSIENQTNFRILFNDLCFKHGSFWDFKLGLISSDSMFPLPRYFKYLDTLTIKRIRSSQLIKEEYLKEIIQLIDTSTCVVTSRIAGLGKSYYVEQQAKKERKDIIRFPITGDANMRNVGNRLSDIKFECPSILAIQVSYVENPLVLNKILMDLTLFGVFYYSTDIFVIPKNCSIYIEIANTFEDTLLNSLAYIKFLRHHYIDRINMDLFNVPNRIDDKVHYICSYLSLYRNNQLNRSEINEETSRNMYIHSIHAVRIFLSEYFINQQYQRQEDTNFIQLTIFIKVLYRLLKNFTNCPYFSVVTIKELIRNSRANGLALLTEEFSQLRNTILNAFLLTTEEFTTKSATNVRELQQLATSTLSSCGPRESNIRNSPERQFQCALSWESSSHFNLIILDDGALVSIYRVQEQVPENIKRLLFIQENALSIQGPDLSNMIQQGAYYITDYSTLSHYELLMKLNTFSKIPNFIDTLRDSEYVMTPDNFLKMSLIYLRVQSEVPVVIMGETGCGKTSLIRFFATKVLCDQLRIFSIHAGVTNENIVQTMNEYTEIAKILSEEDPTKKLWVFFDEFNTSESIGLICEIICNRTLLGKQLPENMAFLAACNPYRIKEDASLFEENVGIKKASKALAGNTTRLVHRVKPLPDSIIEYIWDFGTLNESDSRSYVEAMFRNAGFIHYEELFVNLICFSQNYFQSYEDASSVSLRDVSRFIILFKWFQCTTNQKKMNKEGVLDDKRYISNKQRYQLKIQYGTDPEKTAGILALCHCYYLRIAVENDRRSYLYNITTESEELITYEEIIDTLQNEQNDYLARMELEQGIALNRALKENIFAMIPCIVNKIPVFICGKPGCSKSLSIQLIFANLRGDKSRDPFFRTLPELIMVSFQGSDSCTSNGIIQAFERAKKYLKTEKNTEGSGILPVIVFDEIGLAELSKYNPLKVLHSLLELEHREIGFIGISNWRLDASKMNRVLYLARPDPDQEDLISTAMSIYISYPNSSGDNKNVIESLAKSYFSLKKEYKDTGYADFYGLRDFYHLIKQVSKNLAMGATTRDDIARIAKRAIERNFGGPIKAAKKMGSFFTEEYKISDIYPKIQPSKVIELIKENLADKDARYLMLIGREDVINFIFDEHLDIGLADRRTMMGSTLQDDEHQEEYGFRSLSDIILYMERGISMILKSMEHIYSSLYDLFNQNFAVSGERRYCRIALGALFNPRCFVNENFHVIVLFDDNEQTLLSADPPFLNRFEKHRLRLSELLDSDQERVVNELEEWVDSLVSVENEQPNCLEKTNLFPIYSRESLSLLSLRHYENSIADAIDKCKESLIRTSSADILLLSEIARIDHEEKECIQMTWRNLHKLSFPATLKKMLGTSKSDKLLAFTFESGIFNTRLLTEYEDSIHQRDISSFKTEQDLRQDISLFLSCPKKSLYLMELDLSSESKHISLLKYMYEKLEAENYGVSKNICIVAHMMRNIKYDLSTNLLEGWEMVMFDELQEHRFEITDEIIRKSTEELIDEEFVKFEDIITTLTEKCLLNFQYKSKTGNIIKEQFIRRMSFLIENIEKDSRLVAAFKGKILESIKEVAPWKYAIFCDSEIVMGSDKLKTAITLAIEKEYRKPFNVFLFLLEKDNAFESYFTCHEEPLGEIIRDIWCWNFNKLSGELIVLQNLNQNTPIYYECTLTFPFILFDYRMINDLFHEVAAIKRDFDDEEKTVYARGVFRIKYRKKSVISQYFEQIEGEDELQEIYFRDILRLKLIDHLLSLEYEPVLFILFQLATSQQNSIEDKLLLLLENEEVFFMICRAIGIYSILIDSFTLDSFAEKLLLLESESPWKATVGSFFTNDTLAIYPSETILSAHGPENYFSLIENLLNALFELTLEDVKIESVECLTFWSSYIRFAIRSRLPMEIIYYTAAKAIEIDQTEGFFLYSMDFKKFLIETANYYAKPDDYALLKFKSSYFTRILKTCPFSLIDVAREFEHSNMWKYSSAIIDDILKESGIVRLIENLKIEIKDKLIIETNEYAEAIENCLLELGFTCRFTVMLSDAICKLDYQIEDDGFEYASQYPLFNLSVKTVGRNAKKYPNLKRLIAISVIREYLDSNMGWILDQEPKFPSKKAEEIHNDIHKFLLTSEFHATMQLFCLKTQFTPNLNILTLDQFLKTSKSQWRQNFDELRAPNTLDIFPYIPSIKETYNSVSLRIVLLLTENPGIDILDQMIKDANTTTRLAIGLAFLNHVFLLHLKEDENRYINEWLSHKEELLEQCLGHGMTRLISFFIRNFDQKSLLRISPKTSPEKLHDVLAVCFIITVFICSNKKLNPLTDLFYDETGEIPKDFTRRFNSKFVLAAESHPLHEHLRELLENSEGIKNSGRGTFKCADDCDYIYVDGDCGRCIEEMKCPYCGKIIGGTQGNLHARPGHREVSHGEAKELIRVKYEENTKRGRYLYGINCPDAAPRGMNSLGYRVLNMVLNSIMYSLYSLGLVPEYEMTDILRVNENNFEEFFTQNIQYQIRKIKNLINEEDGYIWIYRVISEFSNALDKAVGPADDRKQRDQFEILLQNAMIDPFSDSPIDSILEYKAKIKTDFEQGTSLVDYIQELKGIGDERYPCIEFFRLREQAELSQMVNYLEISKQKSEFKLLDVYFRFRGDFENLMHFYPIVEFTNALLEHYNHRISRSEARATPMSTVLEQHKELKPLFSTFLESWNSLNAIELQYDCTPLPPLEFSINSELIYFLADNKEKGGGMYMSAILIQLAQVQNKLLSEIINIYAANKNLDPDYIIEKRRYNIQSIKQGNILTDFMSNEDLIHFFAVNNPCYGRGRENAYDLEGLQDNFVKDLMSKKFLFEDKLALIQYQFELLNMQGEESGLITEISKTIPQTQFVKRTQRELSLFFDDLDVNRSSLILREIYTSLSYILCYLKNSMESPETLISDYCNSPHLSKVSEHVKKHSPIPKLPLKNIIALYELVETKYFPHIQNLIHESFKQEDLKDEISKELQNLLKTCESSETLPKKPQIATAVMRLIMRCLTADLNPDLPLKMYISRPDFWNVNEESVEAFSELFPDTILLSHSLCTYTILAKEEKPPKSKRPVEEEKSALPEKRKPNLKTTRTIRR